MKTLIELSDKQSETLSGGWYMASNFLSVGQRNGAANIAVALGGASFVASGQFNDAIVTSLLV
jgi:hypothetical protein